MQTRITMPDRERIELEAQDVWHLIFERYDNDITFSTDDAATFATAAAEAVKAKMEEILSVWIPS